MATAPPASAPASTPPPPPTAPASSSPPPVPASSPPPTNSTSPPPASSPPPSSPATPSSPPSSTPSLPPPPGSPPSTPSPPPPPSSTTPSTTSTPSTRPTPSTPTTKSPPPPPSSSSSSSGSVPVPVVAGIAVAAAVILIFVSVICICCRKKKRRREERWEYHGQRPPPPPPSRPDKAGSDGPYGGYAQSWQNTAPPPSDNVVKISPPPAPPPAVASRPPQPPSPPPPPPPPVISSSGGSGSMYSGSNAPPLPPPSPGLALGFSKSTFTYEELAIATNGFSSENLLGQGGFGYVHKGILRNGKEVAIKQLKSGSGQGEREFQAEVEIISRVHHKHLVSLVGYCISGTQRLLIYEFVPNNTLEFHLHGKSQPTMDWSTRLKIALGAARGLAYLHEDCHPRIIHRDIKAANILLDFKFEAKVADFGLAKLSADNNTHVSTRVMGTFGYLAPEYASSGKLTEKSDVFSFGVMLLELITGRRPFDASQSFVDDSLVDWARPLLTRSLDERNFEALADPKLHNNYNNSEMAHMVACAAAAVRHSARRRPRMSQIVRALEGDVSLEDLNEGVRPGHSTVYGSYGSSDYDSGQYNEDLRRFRQMAFGQGEGLTGPSTSSSEGQQTRELEMEGMRKQNRG